MATLFQQKYPGANYFAPFAPGLRIDEWQAK
jgi:hypothetical protein